MTDCLRPIWSSRRPAATALVLLAGACLVAAQERQVIFQDDFEGYRSTEAMRVVWPGGTGILETNAPGGGQAALHDGGNLNAHSGLSLVVNAAHLVVFTADLYDSGTNEVKRTTVALRNTSGANLEFGMINEGFCYYARAVGFDVPPDWQPFDSTQKPVEGWHRFQAVLSATNTVVTLDLGADGTIDKTLTFAGPAPRSPFTMVRFGGLPARTSRGGPVLVDNVKVEVVSLAPTVQVSAGGEAAPKSQPEQLAPTNVPTANSRDAELSKAESNPDFAAVVPVAAAAPATERGLGPIGWAIAGALVVVIGLLAWLVLMFQRSTQGGTRALLVSQPTLPAPGETASNAADGVPGNEWKQRALVAEALAQKQAQVLREKLVPELAEFAKQGLVQGLYTQRNDLVETQQRAQKELAELESRLASLQLPLQERIEAYEKRISELELELETRGEEMRELIRATLLLVRQRLDEEKEKERTQAGRN